MSGAPRRLIVKSTPPRRRRGGPAGLLAVSILECGHLADTTATDRRKQGVYCWDCFYRKPADRMGLDILEELGLQPCSEGSAR